MTIKEQVEKIKVCFSVESFPLIKTDRFTQEELNEMIATDNGRAHCSHYNHIKPNSKVFSDLEIENQLITFMSQNVFSNSDLIDKESVIFKSLKFLDYKTDFDNYKTALYNLVGWTGLTQLDGNFWTKFGSAPFFISDTNKQLVEMQKKYGACGLNELFGKDRFSNGYHQTYTIPNLLGSFKIKWEDASKINNKKNTIYTSTYNTIDEMEEILSVKKIKEEAENFYLDKTKSIEERCKAFSKYAEKETYIHEPKNPYLKKMFEIFSEDDSMERHQNINCIDIVEWWIETLINTRSFIDYSKNQYHPSIKSKKRNYKASKTAINRLKLYYIEKLFLEGVGSFEFDW